MAPPAAENFTEENEVCALCAKLFSAKIVLRSGAGVCVEFNWLRRWTAASLISAYVTKMRALWKSGNKYAAEGARKSSTKKQFLRFRDQNAGANINETFHAET